MDDSLLDPQTRRELAGLGASMAALVGAHLAAAGLAIDSEPELAVAHAEEARRLAGRSAVVREALGLAAYAAGRFTVARSQLRAARRMGRGADLVPVLADCERALGDPAAALRLAAEVDPGKLELADQVELAIVVSGARRDLGEAAAAAAVLRGPELDPPALRPWTVRLWYAYAEALLAGGDRAGARRYFAAAAQADEEAETDADERLAALAGRGGASSGQPS